MHTFILSGLAGPERGLASRPRHRACCPSRWRGCLPSPALAAILLFVSCGGEERSEDSPDAKAGSEVVALAGTRIIEGGQVVRSSTATCSRPECGRCPVPSYADVLVSGARTVAVVCYPARARTLRPRSGSSLNLNAGDATVAIDLSGVPGNLFIGDINLNTIGSATIFGSTSTPTRVLGNLNLHAGGVRVVGLDVEGDVSFNRDRQPSALVDVVVRGNLNVHVEGFVGVRSVVFGDLNVNRAGSVLSAVSFGQNANIHGSPRWCERLFAFSDQNQNGHVEASERSAVSSCP